MSMAFSRLSIGINPIGIDPAACFGYKNNAEARGSFLCLTTGLAMLAMQPQH